MNDQFVEGGNLNKQNPADIFRAWADRIEKNAPEDFSGAFLIIPPTGEPICGLLIDQAPDVNTFFAVTKSKIDAAVDVLNERQRQSNGFR